MLFLFCSAVLCSVEPVLFCTVLLSSVPLSSALFCFVLFYQYYIVYIYMNGFLVSSALFILFIARCFRQLSIVYQSWSIKSPFSHSQATHHTTRPTDSVFLHLLKRARQYYCLSILVLLKGSEDSIKGNNDLLIFCSHSIHAKTKEIG